MHVEIAEQSGHYHASIDGGTEFLVGRSVTYQGKRARSVGLDGGNSSHARKYDPAHYEALYREWAYMIYPTAVCESGAFFTSVNTYDRAFFTFGFMQFAAHVPDGDFVRFFRSLLAIPEAAVYFPDLLVANNRISLVESQGSVPLESSSSSELLMTYLNPTILAVEETEVINAAKFIDLTNSNQDVNQLQVEHAIMNFRSGMKSLAKRYRLSGRLDTVCLIIADIKHQGRLRDSKLIETAIDTKGDEEAACTNLLTIGSNEYPDRIKTLKQEIAKLKASGHLGSKLYDDRLDGMVHLA